MPLETMTSGNSTQVKIQLIIKVIEATFSSFENSYLCGFSFHPVCLILDAASHNCHSRISPNASLMLWSRARGVLERRSSL